MHRLASDNSPLTDAREYGCIQILFKYYLFMSKKNTDVKTSITIPEDIAEHLEERTCGRSRSETITADMVAYWQVLRFAMRGVVRCITRDEARTICRVLDSNWWIRRSTDLVGEMTLEGIMGLGSFGEKNSKEDVETAINAVGRLTRIRQIAMADFARRAVYHGLEDEDFFSQFSATVEHTGIKKISDKEGE